MMYKDVLYTATAWMQSRGVAMDGVYVARGQDARSDSVQGRTVIENCSCIFDISAIHGGHVARRLQGSKR